MNAFFRKPRVMYLLSALAITGGDFVLFIATFIFAALFQNVLRFIVGLFMPLGPETGARWLPLLMHGLFVVIIIIISWFVLKLRMRVLFKAIYLTVPVATVLVTTGMFLNHWPIISYTVGAILCLCTLYCFYRTKQPWLYYYTVVLVGLTLAIFTLTGGEI